jgi:hypothetical protein
MHYSWGIYTTRPYFGTTLKNYGYFSNPSLPVWYLYDPDRKQPPPTKSV